MNTESEVLQLWEQAVGREPAAREDVLLRHAGRRVATLGERNAALLGLRSRLFGARLGLRSDCPACGTTTEFDVDTGELLRTCTPSIASSESHELEIDGYRVRFRLPRIDDLRPLVGRSADASAALLDRCLIEHRAPHDRVQPGDADALPDNVKEAIAAQMELLDPGALLSFAVDCPSCEHRWEAPLDVAAALWSELQVAAEQTLLEIDTLARAYGWSEPEVLALGRTRRAAYLQLAGAP